MAESKATIRSRPAALGLSAALAATGVIGLAGTAQAATSNGPAPTGIVVSQLHHLRAYWTTQMTNVRSGPGRDYPVIAQLPRGVEVTVVARHHGWSRLATGGWVHSDLLSSHHRHHYHNPIRHHASWYYHHVEPTTVITHVETNPVVTYVVPGPIVTQVVPGPIVTHVQTVPGPVVTSTVSPAPQRDPWGRHADGPRDPNSTTQSETPTVAPTDPALPTEPTSTTSADSTPADLAPLTDPTPPVETASPTDPTPTDTTPPESPSPEVTESGLVADEYQAVDQGTDGGAPGTGELNSWDDSVATTS